MERRDFLKSSMYTTAGLSLLNKSYGFNDNYSPKLFDFNNNLNNPISEEEFLADDAIIIILDLSGGNDGLNTFIPVWDDNYHRIRPRIRIEEKDAIRFQSSNLYMHPALAHEIFADGFLGLLDRGNLAVIENVGYENHTQSHFRSADIYESGIISLDPKKVFTDGWLGRFFAEKLVSFPELLPPHPLSISLEGKVPLTYRSPKGDMAIAMNNPQMLKTFGNGLTPVEALLPKTSRFNNEYNFIHAIARQSEIYSTAVYSAYEKGANAVGYAGDALGQKFGLIARLISGGLNTKSYFIRMGGFDSHAQQMREVLAGQHPLLLRSISDAISRFVGDATTQGFMNRVTIVCTSEFGRRPTDNGSRGSDHGAANSMFMVSHFDNITAGRIGTPPDLGNLDNNGNLPHEFDFRRVYADILRVWFRATPEEVTKVFGEEILPLGVLKPRVINNSIFDKPIIQNSTLYPNPSSGASKLQFNLINGANVEIKVFRINGTKYSDIYSGYLYSGDNTFNLNIYESGQFIVYLKINEQIYSENIIINR